MDAVFPQYTLSRGEVIWTEESIDAKAGRGNFLEGSGIGSEEDLGRGSLRKLSETRG